MPRWCRELAAHGKDGFYKGRVGKAIVEVLASMGGVNKQSTHNLQKQSHAGGGGGAGGGSVLYDDMLHGVFLIGAQVMTEADLASHITTFPDPITTNYRGADRPRTAASARWGRRPAPICLAHAPCLLPGMPPDNNSALAWTCTRQAERAGAAVHAANSKCRLHSTRWPNSPPNAGSGHLYRTGVDVYEIPPNGQGLTALIGLNILEGFDVKAMGHNSPQALHVMIEAMRCQHNPTAHSNCTLQLHTPTSHSNCSLQLHTPTAHSNCTRFVSVDVCFSHG